MALPTSGPLTLADIQGEFGGINPIGLDEYYAGGGLVPPGTSGTYGAVPTSGQISIKNFYGTTAVVVDFSDQYIIAADFGYAQAGYWIAGATGGGVTIGNAYQFTQAGPPTLLEQWCTPTSQAGNYEVYAAYTGSLPTGSAVNTWVATTTNPSWYVDVFGSGNSSICTLTLQVRRTGTTTVLDTWQVIIEADAF